MAEPQAIIGRGASEGARLFRDWFGGLERAAADHGRIAYVFVMGSLAELLRSFDFELVFPEITSLQTAVRRTSDQLLSEAEDYGYSTDVCGYVKADVAVQLRRGAHPMGRIPKPSIAVLTNACNTYVKWAEIWERLHGMPAYVLDVPGTRSGNSPTPPTAADVARDRQYVIRQLHELIELCERVTGMRFDIDRLRERMGCANDMSRAYRELLDLNRARPAPFNAVTDGTVYLGVANAFRGTPEGAAYFRDLVEEMRLKVTQGLGTLREEQYRLVFVGVPCYPIFRRFNEMFLEWGGAFVGSTYLWFASGGADLGWEYDLRRPIESLAEGVLASVQHAMDGMFFQDRLVAELIEPFAIDGVVYHPIKSCRTVSTGLADGRRVLTERTGIASLFLESDMMDKRVVSEAQLKNRIDAFFEGLAARKARGER